MDTTIVVVHLRHAVTALVGMTIAVDPLLLVMTTIRSPPPRAAGGPPIDEPYPPARGGYREPDPYAAPPPRRGGYDDPYAPNGYDRPRARSPPRAYGGYEDRPPPRYW